MSEDPPPYVVVWDAELYLWHPYWVSYGKKDWPSRSFWLAPGTYAWD